MAIALQSGMALAESAMLECISSKHVDTKGGASIFYQFRISMVSGWKLSHASLLLHAVGEAPKSVEVGLADQKWNEFDPATTPTASGFRKYAATPVKDGWVRVELDAAQAQQIKHGVAVRVQGAREKPFDMRETMQFSPYLMVEGTSK